MQVGAAIGRLLRNTYALESIDRFINGIKFLLSFAYQLPIYWFNIGIQMLIEFILLKFTDVTQNDTCFHALHSNELTAGS